MSTHKRQSPSLLCPQNRKTPRQVFGAFSLAGRYTELRYKSENGGRSMRRFLGWLVLAAAFAAACLYTWCLGVPAFRGEAGPCSVTVTCPGGAAPTVYSYDLVGDGFCRTLHISYDPARPNADSAVFRDLPPGEYRILENGVERSRVQISMENPSAHVRPDNTWPTAPPR